MAPGTNTFGQPTFGQEVITPTTPVRADGPHFDVMLDGVNWTEITGDTRAELGATLDYGMPDGKPTTRIAKTGTMRFYLDNSGALNSGGKLGYYSPVNGNCRAGFGQGIPFRFVYILSGVQYYKFFGRLSVIDPYAGKNRAMYTAVTAVDYMDDLARANLTGLSTVVNGFHSDILGAVLRGMTNKPNFVSMDAGTVQFPWGLVGGSSGVVNAMQECQRLTLSEFGYLYVKGDQLNGGHLHLENQLSRVGSTSKFTIIDAMQENPAGVNPLEVVSDIADVINFVQATLHPRKVDGSVGSEVVLYSSLNASSTTPTKVAAGASVTVNAPYRDPNQTSTMLSGQIAGTSMLQPVATTDYQANAAADGSGADLTGNISVAATFGSTGATLVVSNNGGTDAYIRKLQVRGVGLYDYDQQSALASDAASRAKFNDKTLNVDLAYVSDPVVAQTIANTILNAWKNPFGFAKTVSFQCDTNTKLLAACSLEVGDRITVGESVTGIAADFFIAGVRWDMRPSAWITCTWLLSPASFVPVGWRLGVAGASELGVTTTLS